MTQEEQNLSEICKFIILNLFFLKKLGHYELNQVFQYKSESDEKNKMTLFSFFYK